VIEEPVRKRACRAIQKLEKALDKYMDAMDALYRAYARDPFDRAMVKRMTKSFAALPEAERKRITAMWSEARSALNERSHRYPEVYAFLQSLRVTSERLAQSKVRVSRPKREEYAHMLDFFASQPRITDETIASRMIMLGLEKNDDGALKRVRSALDEREQELARLRDVAVAGPAKKKRQESR
jgi:hypothetical protein